MKIRDILKIADNPKIGNLEIKEIADDSRSLTAGSLFFVIKRPRFDIFSVLKKTEKKVSAYVADFKDKKKVEERINKKPVIYVKGVDNYFHQAVCRFYKPDRKLKVVGVTGTNGKTSTAYFLYQLLKKAKKKTALFATTGYFFNSSKLKSSHTTADFLILHKLIKKISQKGIKYLVLEVSSHGIDQGRVKGINFSSCVFTNLSRDHLDYHKTMSSYFETKKSFFMGNPRAYSIINNDCAYGRKIPVPASKKISYGIKNTADYQANNINFFGDRTRFDLACKGRKFSISASFLGRHNILNLLAAIASARSLGLPMPQILDSVPFLKKPEGRLEKVDDVFIDYAHTPESLELTLSSLRDAGYQKIISLFGCGGNRDKGKRKIMGKISSRLADFTVITSDNPRGEDPLVICNQIKEGARNDNFYLVLDRKEAIEAGIKLLKKFKASGQKTCLLVAGKGHEGLQIIKDKKIKFKDKEVVKQFLRLTFNVRRSTLI